MARREGRRPLPQAPAQRRVPALRRGRPTAGPTGPAAIFVNRSASGARSARTRRSVELARRALAADLHATDARSADELSAWLAERIGEYRTAVIAGGDGTLSLAYNRVAGRAVSAAPPGPALGYIPAGFGNATARLLSLPRDPAELAEVLARGDARPVDLVEAGDRLALFVGFGWDATVVERYSSGPLRGLAGWSLAIGRSLPGLLHRPTVAIETAFGAELYHGPITLLVASTTPWYGRGLRVNPGARADAGLLTLRAYPGPAHRLGVEAVRWLAHRRPSVPPIAGDEFLVRRQDGGPLLAQADGDVIGHRDAWSLRVRPAAVRLIGRW